MRNLHVITILFAATLASCARIEPISQSDAGPYPHDYKIEAKTYIMEAFKDPYSLRNTQISKPEPVNIPGIGKGYRVCLRLNSKNSMGGYTGLKDYELLLQNGRMKNTTMGDWGCKGVSYTAWPDIETLGD